MGLKSIIMTRNSINRNGQTSVQDRYFISSLSLGAGRFFVLYAVIGWLRVRIGIYIDVTFREDKDHTLDKHVAFNLNIMRKLALNLLKLLDMGRVGVGVCVKDAIHNLL